MVFVAKNGHGEKVVKKTLLSEDDQEKRLFIKEAKILHGINSEHIVKFRAACMEPRTMMQEDLFFDFAFFGGSVIVSTLDRLLQHLHMNETIDQFLLQWKRQPGLHTCITLKSMQKYTSLNESIEFFIWLII